MPALADLLPPEPTSDPDVVLERFLAWVQTTGLTLYPAQEEALLELMAGKHVLLATPTGSGKSLVATALLFAALARNERAVCTFPIKALVNVKWVQLCREFGPFSSRRSSNGVIHRAGTGPAAKPVIVTFS